MKFTKNAVMFVYLNKTNNLSFCYKKYSLKFVYYKNNCYLCTRKQGNKQFM